MAAGLKRKLEGEIEMPAGDANALYEICVYRPDDISKISPGFIQSCDLVEGAFGTSGSIIRWRYTLDGKEFVSKHRIEVCEENKVLKLNVIEGDILNVYKSFGVIYQVIPKDKETSIVKWKFEYEKKQQGIPEPTALMDALIAVCKDFCGHSSSK